ncbi:MAG TPA: hypothetical protein VGM80_06930, partial [Gaiellaceae bacterium]
TDPGERIPLARTKAQEPTSLQRISNLITTRLATALSNGQLLFLRREEGQTLAEYGIIMGFLVIVVIVAIPPLRVQLSGMFSSIDSKI